ncbi:hypothetical protein LCL85_14175 [Vibrio alginolyticus]|nr:hypothetical protein [Vibrio alginolyticus]
MKKGLNVDNHAKRLCDGLWYSYSVRYPEFKDRIPAIFFYIAMYQHLVSHSSASGSDGRKLQLELIHSFEVWYPNIEYARKIDWINLDREVLDTIQAETGDYSYGYKGSHVRDYDTEHAWERCINHQLFQLLPISKSVIEQTNLNQEIYRQIKNQIVGFDSTPINTEIPGEQELYELMADDISRLLIGSSVKSNELDVYLYLFGSAALGNQKSKQECAQLGSSIQIRVKEIKCEGTIPRPIDLVWKMGRGYSNGLVEDYDQLISFLESQFCTISCEEINDGFELSVWRYPNKQATLQKVVMKGDGRYELVGETQLSFDDAQATAEHLIMVLTSES